MRSTISFGDAFKVFVSQNVMQFLFSFVKSMHWWVGGWVGFGWHHKINAFFRFYRKSSALVAGGEGEKILEIFTIYFARTT